MNHSRGLDLGIAGRKAIVCGSSSGLGKACAMALAHAGVDLVMTARTAATLHEAAQEIRHVTGVSVTEVACDVTTEQGRNVVLAASPRADILVNNSAGPPSGNFRDWDEAQWVSAVTANMISPILMIRSVVDSMAARGWGRIINITSYSAKYPLPLLGLSNGARSGLIGFVSGLAREVAPSGVTINNLLPGNFDTERFGAYTRKLAEKRGISEQEILSEMAASTPVGRIGNPEEFGTWCAFLASQHSGYVTAQNYVLDGGTYPGTY